MLSNTIRDRLASGVDTLENRWRVSREFRAAMRRDLGIETCRQIDIQNSRRNDGDRTCASHDYCDANMPMLAAVSGVLGISEDDACERMGQGDDVLCLVNAAWVHAKATGFATKEEEL